MLKHHNLSTRPGQNHPIPRHLWLQLRAHLGVKECSPDLSSLAWPLPVTLSPRAPVNPHDPPGLTKGLAPLVIGTVSLASERSLGQDWPSATNRRNKQGIF